LKKKSILFCGNGFSGEILKFLKDEYQIFMISEYRNDRGMEYVDKFIRGNSLEPADALKAAINLYNMGYKFDAVLSLCIDTAMSVAKIAEQFNLFGISYDVARKATMKSLRSQAFESHKIPAPNYRICSDYSDLEKKVEEIGLPVVLKPLDLFSSKGVILVESREKLKSAYDYCTSFTNKPEIVINEYLQGTEYSTEGLMIDEKFYLTGISERLFHYKKCKPLFVEIGDIMPTLLSKSEIDCCIQVTEKAALALDIKNGVVKGDLIYTKGQIKVLEITPRLGGPRFGTEMIPLSNGTNILRAVIQQALGLKINMDYLTPKFHKGMVNRSIFPKPGRITKISGLQEIIDLPGYYDFKWWKVMPFKVGDIIHKPENMCGGVGYIIVTGKDRNEALENADRIERTIMIETENV
jgi:biotin carboxylase